MCHDIPNLGIIDGSVFVTAGAVNPTSTICALALRAVEHLIETRRSQRTPNRPKMLAPRGANSESMATAPVRLKQPAGQFDAASRATLAELAELLIPAGDGMPSASDILVSGDVLDRVLSSRGDLADPLQRALELGGDRPWNDATRLLAHLEAKDATARDALVTVVAGAYYMDERVRKLLGYPGQLARPVNALEFPAYIEEGLLDHVPTPGGAGLP
jgi:hypothetical protein